MAAPRPPLGGLSPHAFLRNHWQKRPLLVRQAVPGFAGILGRRELFSLAASDDAESRLVESRPRWRVTPGPLDPRALSRLPARNWTLLVNGVNLHSSRADGLLSRFAFLSWARLDDVMVSDASPGGGVGPHVDSYDVFLLQGPGRRRWRLMGPGARPFRLVAGAPLRLIEGFRPTEELVLDAGDMLYLPPGWGHEGTALESCQTYSIGFRAPGGVELSTAFLDFLHERGFEDSPYRDPGRRPSAHPARIDAHMIGHAVESLGRIRWTRADVARFMGRYLSEPKPQVTFDAPAPRLGLRAFVRKLETARVELDPRTRMLTHANSVFVNGTQSSVDGRSRAVLQELADRRQVEGARLARSGTVELIFDWYRQGYLLLGNKP